MNDFSQYEIYGNDDESIYMVHSRCSDVVLDSSDMATVDELIKTINEHRENCGSRSV